MRNEIFMNFHFPARTATCAAAHDGSALSVTLCLFATRSLFPAPPEMPPGFGRPVFRPARLTVPRLTTAPRFCVVTLRALRDGQLLTAPPKMPLACGQPVFRSTQFSVALLPGLRASYYISFAELIFTPGPMVEAHTQERMY
mgnify:CR=1 FL=1